MGKTKEKLKMRGRKFRAITISLIALLLILNVVITVAGNVMETTLDTYVGKGKTIAEPPKESEGWDTDYYEEKYTDNEVAKAAAYEVAQQVMQEGTVLLKNNGVLPLAPGSTITPFGRGFIDPVYGQLTSSGSAKWVYDPISPETALAETYTINEAAIELMNAAGDPEILKEAAGTSEAGVAGSMLGGNSFIYEYDPSIYSEMETAAGTTGLVMITRAGQEGSDKKFDAYEDGTPHYLAISENEKAAIRTAKEKCDNVIVVLASSATIELAPLMSGELEADAIVWVGHPGETGFGVLNDILSGAVNPSGRTVDTYAADLTADPSYQNIGSFAYDNATVMLSSFTDGSGEMARYYTDYQEDMYVGYRYYETADVMDEAFVYGELDDGGAWTMAGAVCYPFGYGLSYTDFSQEIVSYKDSGDEIEVQVKVTNTGDTYAGKEVVQLYYNAPYTQFDVENKIEKPVANLIAFDKTELLEPGKSQTLSLSFAKEDMASYCYTHENPDGTMGCYVLEEGDYEISLRNNSHEVIDTKITTLDETFWYDGSDLTHIRKSDIAAQSDMDDEGNILDTPSNPEGSYVNATNQFQTSSDYMNANSTILSRAAWNTTQPKWEESKSLNEEFFAALGVETGFDVETDAAFGNTKTSIWYSEEEPVSGADYGLTLADMRGKDYYDEDWEKLLDQIDWDKDKKGILMDFAGAAYATGAVASMEMPGTVIEDGANGLKVQGNDNGYDMSKSSSFPFGPTMAATWNEDLLYAVGEAFGQESMANGINGWYCPAVNLHRNQFSGRIFEYYSEDPVLSGKLAARVISGAGDQGMYCTIKHFALNDMETNRSALCTVWATEQTMRELYFKPFEIAIKEARMTIKYTADEQGTVRTKTMRAANAVMPSQAGVGAVVGTCNYSLLQSVLRDEWGFEGVVYSDYWVWSDNSFRDLAMRVGCDIYLCMYMPFMWSLEDYDSVYAKNAMRAALHNIGYVTVNSNAMQNAAPGTTFRVTMSPWKKVLIPVNLLGYGLTVFFIVLEVRRKKDEKVHPERYKQKKVK